MLEYLKYVMDFEWAHGMSLTAARIFFMTFFILITVFGISFGREFIFRDAEDSKRWRDLRLWVVVIMIIQIGLYTVF